jgi:hypothetical protein
VVHVFGQQLVMKVMDGDEVVVTGGRLGEMFFASLGLACEGLVVEFARQPLVPANPEIAAAVGVAVNILLLSNRVP